MTASPAPSAGPLQLPPLENGNPWVGQSDAGLIVQGSFTSIRQMVDYQRPRSIFPTDLLLNQHFDSIRKVPRLQMPLLYIHGLDDDKVPASMSQALYAASLEPKQIYYD